MTCTDGVRNIEKTADNTPVVFDVPDYEEWTVSALRDDLPSDTVTVVVDTAKQYTAALAFFTSTITVMVETGSTVVCESGGKTQTKTSDGSVVFTVISAAAYTITATTGDETTSGTVEITASEQAKAITLEYFHSMITVNVAAGAYVTCTDGRVTLDGNSNGAVVFEVHNAAAWRIAASMNGRSITGTASQKRFSLFTSKFTAFHGTVQARQNCPEQTTRDCSQTPRPPWRLVRDSPHLMIVTHGTV